MLDGPGPLLSLALEQRALQSLKAARAGLYEALVIRRWIAVQNSPNQPTLLGIGRRGRTIDFSRQWRHVNPRLSYLAPLAVQGGVVFGEGTLQNSGNRPARPDVPTLGVADVPHRGTRHGCPSLTAPSVP